MGDYMKKIIFPLLLIMMIFSLTACKDEESSNNDKPSITDKGDNNDDGTKKPSFTDNVETDENNDSSSSDSNSSSLPPDYKDISGEYSSTAEPSITTPVESTVELVYDSVVSINVAGLGFTSSGSGVLFQEDENLGFSYIATCFHVIENGTNIEVVLLNGDKYSASVVAGYKDQDLAVLAIKKIDLTYATLFEDSNELKLGSQVVCIGNPLGTLPGSISSGYLSYINREIYIDDYQSMKLLQTDVAINSGNSGGGLFNTSGALIGIVNAKYADEAIEGLGFAIPINTVKDVIADFLETAKYDAANDTWKEGYYVGDWELGATITDGYYGNGYGYTSVVYVKDVASNATATGSDELLSQDIIIALEIDYTSEDKTDKSIMFNNASELLNGIYDADLSVGDTLIFSISRNDFNQTIVITVEQFIYSI